MSGNYLPQRGLRRTVAFLLTLALIFSVTFPGFLVQEAYADDESVNISIRIEGEDSTVLSYTELSVGKFDIKPFLTGDTGSFEEPAEIVSAHALIEAIYYIKYGEDPDISTFSSPGLSDEIVNDIKEELTISYGSYGLGINDISGNDKLVMSAINDAGGSGIGIDTISEGDSLVFWPYTESYSYFNVVTSGEVSVAPFGDTSYITGKVALVLKKDEWGVVSPVAEAELVITDENGIILTTENYDYGVPPNYDDDIAITNAAGLASIDLYGNCLTEDESSFEKTFIVSSNMMGIVKPHCKIVMTAENIVFSQPVDSTGVEPTDPVVEHKEDISEDVQAVIEGIRDVNDSHEPSYYDNDWAIGMAAAGLMPTQEEKDSYLTWVLDELVKAGASIATKAKTAIALTAFNIDARYVPNRNTGETINLIDAVAYSSPEEIDATWTAPFLLFLYDLGNYEVPLDASVTRELLITIIMDGKDDWVKYGTDGVGAVMASLAAYYDSGTEVNGISAEVCEEVTLVLDETLESLYSSMDEYGGFPGWGGDLSSNTQAYVITGLTALGIDPHTEFYKSASAMDNLLSYKTEDNKLGFSDNTEANDLASKQGLGALAVYQNLSNSRSSNLYHFTKETAPYTNWPDTDLMTGLIVKPPNKTIYDYNGSITQQVIDTEGLAVKAVFNGDAANTTEVPIESCTISTINLSKPGAQTVTVSYRGLTDTFLVTVKESTGTVPTANTVSVKVRSGKTIIASSNSVAIEKNVTTVMDVLIKVLNDAGINYVIRGKAYVSTIDGLGEFDRGENSGWLYYVDGKDLGISASAHKLDGGEVIEWIYTLDYTKEKGSEKWNQTVLTEEITGSITKETMDSILKKMKADNEGSWTVDLAQGSITFDKDALEELIDQMKGDTVEITIELAAQKDLSAKQREAVSDRPVYNIRVVSGGKEISGFGGKLTITLPYTLKKGESPSGVLVYRMDSLGNLTPLGGSYDPVSGKVAFISDQLSYYMVGYDKTLVKWPFADVRSGDGADWYYDAVKYVYENGIFAGTSTTAFEPNSPLTRSMLVSVLARMSGADLTTYKTTGFSDVDMNSWYGPSVAWAEEMGIISGYAGKDGSFTFRPDDRISRQDIAVMINNYNEKVAKKVYSKSADSVTFTDRGQIGDYAKTAVSAMQQAGIINGVKNADGSFRFQPLNNATRAEAATMIYNMLIGD